VRDVVIVGSGPAGYTAAIYTGRAGLDPVVVAGSVTAGGALMNTTEVENFPGFPDGVQGPALMEAMRAQAEKFGAEVVWDDATSLKLDGATKTVTIGDGTTYHARTVILATGAAHRALGVDGEDRLTGHGVSWCATCDGFFFRDREVVVVGGGDAAVEEAVFLARFASKVTLVHRRDQLRAAKVVADRALSNPKISLAWNSQVVAIHGAGQVTGVTLADAHTGERRELATSAVFIAIGHLPRTELVNTQVTLNESGYIAVAPRSTHTNLVGVFACGDVVDSVYRQAITAAGSGCAAALDAQHYLASIDPTITDPEPPGESLVVV
jgi:thioredoxin reductase (NADPH)